MFPSCHRAFAAPGLWLFIGLSAACGSDTGRRAPDVALASGIGAQSEFRSLRTRFFDADGAGRVALLPDLTAFLERYPDDRRALQVRVFVAWAELERGRREAAREQLAPVLAGRDGATRDFARVASAALDARGGHPLRALDALDRLEGRIVDLDERFVYGEERTRAAFAAGERTRAFAALLAWLAQAPPDRLPRARATARTLLGFVPASGLARALVELDRRTPDAGASSESAAARAWLVTTVVERLTRLALEREDQELARRLLEVAPAAIRGTPEGQRLVKLSTLGAQTPAIAGRAVGLLLDLGDATKRRRAAAVAAGMTRALGIAVDAEGGRRADLIVRSGGGRVAAELAELASEGAGIFVAGLDDASAGAALEFAETQRIPVLLLRKPPKPVPASGYGFVLGLGDAEIERVLAEALAQRGIDRSETIGPGGVPCEAEAALAGRPRFPLAELRKKGVGALLVTADAACARDLAAEVRAAKSPFVLALGLDASQSYATLGVPSLVVSMGSYPTKAPDGGWYEALGHDAALLAARALEALPSEGLVRGGSVEALHEKARDALATAEVELWTSEARGFGRARVLPRTLDLLDGGPSAR